MSQRPDRTYGYRTGYLLPLDSDDPFVRVLLEAGVTHCAVEYSTDEVRYRDHATYCPPIGTDGEMACVYGLHQTREGTRIHDTYDYECEYHIGGGQVVLVFESDWPNPHNRKVHGWKLCRLVIRPGTDCATVADWLRESITEPKLARSVAA